ncbi:MAG TPA: hypothetical protein VMW56_14005 [Candidatus Margulisiibacteriota bacterium]|nr:hypothetical protein [Candidatus Margulisiibacteriota bacterium]
MPGEMGVQHRDWYREVHQRREEILAGYPWLRRKRTIALLTLLLALVLACALVEGYYERQGRLYRERSNMTELIELPATGVPGATGYQRIILCNGNNDCRQISPAVVPRAPVDYGVDRQGRPILSPSP